MRYVEKTVKVLVYLALLLASLSSCAVINPGWSYQHPPRANSVYHGSEKILWCDSVEGARYTSITGWFAADCYYTFLPVNQFKVIETNHEVFGTTKVIVVYCKSKLRDIWIPLPSHGWA